jgi:RES domain-containing protein
VTPLPAALGGTALVGWRLDQAAFASEWNSGEGAYRFGGRWNSRGVRAVYASLDPSTAILEVAVHKSFQALDRVRHVLTSFEVLDASGVHVVEPASVPNPHWLTPGIPSAGQQAFGDDLMARHPFVLIPSTVSQRSWNLMFTPARAEGLYRVRSQEPFALDTRLNPPPDR